jgi:uncharacterized integral membrane protein
MVFKTRSRRAHPRRPDALGVIPEAGSGPLPGGSPLADQADFEPAQRSSSEGGETRRERSRRKAHRSRLHGYAIIAVVLVAFLIALAVANTAHVKVDWVFGSSHVSLVWLVLFAAILGWLLGLVSTAAFRWRTRAPHLAARGDRRGGR